MQGSLTTRERLQRLTSRVVPAWAAAVLGGELFDVLAETGAMAEAEAASASSLSELMPLQGSGSEAIARAYHHSRAVSCAYHHRTAVVRAYANPDAIADPRSHAHTDARSNRSA